MSPIIGSTATLTVVETGEVHELGATVAGFEPAAVEPIPLADWHGETIRTALDHPPVTFTLPVTDLCIGLLDDIAGTRVATLEVHDDGTHTTHTTGRNTP